MRGVPNLGIGLLVADCFVERQSSRDYGPDLEMPVVAGDSKDASTMSDTIALVFDFDDTLAPDSTSSF